MEAGIYGTCDWGGCDEPANHIREGLPVCDKHAVKLSPIASCADCGADAYYRCTVCHAFFCGSSGCKNIPEAQHHPCTHFERVQPAAAAGEPQRFKPGDRVRCKDASRSNGLLDVDRYYVVSSVLGSGHTITLGEIAGEWGASRFELVQPAAEVKTPGITELGELLEAAAELTERLNFLGGMITGADKSWNRFDAALKPFVDGFHPQTWSGEAAARAVAGQQSGFCWLEDLAALRAVIREVHSQHADDLHGQLNRIFQAAGLTPKEESDSQHSEERVQPPFKPGDRVRCVDGESPVLVEGNEYTVERIATDDGTEVFVNGGWWFAHRFELVQPAAERVAPFKPGDRVRCIQPEDTLTLFGEYIVEAYDGDYLRLEGEKRGRYPWRFELVRPAVVQPAEFDLGGLPDGPCQEWRDDKSVDSKTPGQVLIDVLDELLAGAKKNQEREWDNRLSSMDDYWRYVGHVEAYISIRECDAFKAAVAAAQQVAALQRELNTAEANLQVAMKTIKVWENGAIERERHIERLHKQLVAWQAWRDAGASGRELSLMGTIEGLQRKVEELTDVVGKRDRGIERLREQLATVTAERDRIQLSKGPAGAYLAERDLAIEQLAAANKRLVAMEQALKPFAEIADRFPAYLDGAEFFLGRAIEKRSLVDVIVSLGQFRAAAAALAADASQPGKVTAHWLEVALGRVRAGEPEGEVMADYGWVRETK